MENLCGNLISQRTMPSLLIVMLKITFQPFIKIGARLISIQVNILILQASPQAFNGVIQML